VIDCGGRADKSPSDRPSTVREAKNHLEPIRLIVKVPVVNLSLLATLNTTKENNR
jgi:hypothetical protein